jgi:hypothetical protein
MVAGVEECRIVTRLLTLEASVKVFVRAGERHTCVDTHIVVDWNDPGEFPDTMFDLGHTWNNPSESFDTAFDLVIREKPPLRLW